VADALPEYRLNDAEIVPDNVLRCRAGQKPGSSRDIKLVRRAAVC
jgi:hypothetical protein